MRTQDVWQYKLIQYILPVGLYFSYSTGNKLFHNIYFLFIILHKFNYSKNKMGKIFLKTP